MTAEQQRTLDYYEERYQHAVIQMARGRVKTTQDWHRYEQARLDYFGYVKFLRTFTLKAVAA